MVALGAVPHPLIMHALSPLQLITDDAGRLSEARAGFLVAGVTYTVKMWLSMPDDPWMWATYMATVGGVVAARDLVQARFGTRPSAYPAPCAPEPLEPMR